MSQRARRPFKKLWRRGVLLMGLLAIALGLWEYQLASGKLGDAVSWFNAGLKTLQLFVLQIDPASLLTVQGRIAAVLAPLAAAGAVVAAFGERMNRRWRIVGLWWAPATDIFLGGGGTAAGVATRRCRAIGQPVKIVGLDVQVESALSYAMTASNLRGFMLVGDALSHDDLDDLNFRSARNVWISTGDELRNLEIARRVCKRLSTGRNKPDTAVKLFVQIVDQRLVRARDALFMGVDASVVVLEFYAMPRLAARTLLRLHPPSLAHGQEAPHVLILGSSKLAAALALHAVQHCVYSEVPDRSVRITLAGAGAGDLLHLLRRQLAALNPTDDPSMQPLLPLAHLDALETDETELRTVDWQRAQHGGLHPFSVVYAACAHDVGTLHAAMRAVALREIAGAHSADPLPIVVCFQQAPGTEGALADAAGAGPQLSPVLQKIRGLTAFNVYEQCISPNEDYPGERQDQRALLVHAAYNHVLSPDQGSVPADDAMRRRWIARARELWRQQLENGAYRWSSRLCADHIDVKLQLLATLEERADKVISRAGDSDRLADTLQAALAGHDGLIFLARLEHRRFVVERLLEGWLPLPPDRSGFEHSVAGLRSNEQKEDLLLNHTLVPFDRLAEVDPNFDQSKKDIDIVRAIPEILRCERLMAGRPETR